MFDWVDFFYALFMGVLVLLLVALLVAVIFGVVYECSATEVETYTVGCEVTQITYAEKVTGRHSSRSVYKMGVRNDDFATTFNISAEEFAKYAVGDVVEVEVAVCEYMDGSLNNKYKLVN